MDSKAVAEGTFVWPSISDDHVLAALGRKLPNLCTEAEYSEVYGIDLSTGTVFQKYIILQKFLRANANDITKAASQLLETLKWRKSYQPAKAKEEVFDKRKFGGLGFVTSFSNVPGSGNQTDSATFNIYGAVTDNKATFGDLSAFMRWRVAVMEMSVAALDLPNAKNPIPDYGAGVDPYQGFQIHDYNHVSFLRQDANQKAAAKEAIGTFQKYYPETLSRKFFVNVPTVIGWMFSAMKVFMSAETAKKMVVVTHGKDLAAELGNDVPEIYGGSGPDLVATAKSPRTASN